MIKRVMFLLLFTLLFFSCEDKELIEQNTKLKEQVKSLKQSNELYKSSFKNTGFLAKQMTGVKAKIETNYGDIELQFFPEKAPIHCFNFLARAESGFYNNTQFHRIISGFMIQGGDPNTKTKNKSSYGTGGPLVNIPHEFNSLKHERGVLSMARPGDVTVGAGSQFFITHAPTPQLDGQYTVFGKVTNGLDVVDKIATTKTNQRDLPLKAVKIKTIKIYR